MQFAYRELGPSTGVPVVFLTHLAAVLDNWDPRIVEGIAAKHRVITFDNRGVGASSGSTPTSIEEMASDAVTFIRALGLEQVDLFGFSMGGMIAQVIAKQEPGLVRKMILAGTRVSTPVPRVRNTVHSGMWRKSFRFGSSEPSSASC